MSNKRPTIAELIDYEVLLLEEEHPPTPAALARDKAIRDQMSPELTGRWQILHVWMTTLKQTGARKLPGHIFNSYLFYAQNAVLAVALIAGTGTAGMLLPDSSESTVKIFGWILIFAFVPLLLLTSTIGLIVWSHLNAGMKQRSSGWQGPVARVISDKLLAKLQNTSVTQFRLWTKVLARIRRIYMPIIRAQAFTILQLFGVGFYGGALIYLILRARFTDMSFAWGSTIADDAGILRAMIRAVAWPSSWLSEIPSDDLISSSKIGADLISQSPINGALDNRRWWIFLAATVCTYGLVPRVIIYAAGKAVMWKYLAGLRFDDHASASLAHRITPNSQTNYGDKSGKTFSANAWEIRQSQTQTKSRIPCIIVKWRDVPFNRDHITAHVAIPYGLSATAVFDASGTIADQAQLLAALSSSSAPELIVILLDHWERPNRALNKLIRALRSQAHGRLTVLYAPVVEDPDVRLYPTPELTNWQQIIQQQDDLHTGLLADYEVANG
jgi:hypothetical protein